METLTITDTNPTANHIDENAALGTTVTSITLTASGDDTLNALTWELTPPNTPFAINSTSGVVNLTTTLDYEATTQYSVTIRATSNENSIIVAEDLPVAIYIEDVIEALKLHIKLFLEGPLQ